MGTILLLFLFGSIIGFVGGYAGIGGAPFLVVFLVLVLGMSQYEAQGTVLAVMLGPMSLLSVIGLWDKVKHRLEIVVIGVVTYAFLSYFGAAMAYAIPEKLLRLFFAVLLVMLGIHGMYKSTKIDDDAKTMGDERKITRIQILIVGSFVGFVGGLFGIGAGVLMLPIFISVYGMHKDVARAISLAILLPPVSIGAVVKYHEMAAVNWNYALVLFISYFIVNYFGGKVGTDHDNRPFQRYFGVILVLLGFAYLYLLLA